jgi:hypothetical protein
MATVKSLIIYIYIYECKSKSKGTFRKKYTYCKYTETKLILLFNLIPTLVKDASKKLFFLTELKNV